MQCQNIQGFTLIRAVLFWFSNVFLCVVYGRNLNECLELRHIRFSLKNSHIGQQSPINKEHKNQKKSDFSAAWFLFFTTKEGGKIKFGPAIVFYLRVEELNS